MFSTLEVIRQARDSNPGASITEDRVRYAIRRGLVEPTMFAGRLAWSEDDVVKLAKALNIAVPADMEVSRRFVAAI